MAKKIIYTVVAVVGIVAASGAAWWYQSKPVKPKEVSGTPAASPGKGAPAAGANRPAGVEVAKTERAI